MGNLSPGENSELDYSRKIACLINYSHLLNEMQLIYNIPEEGKTFSLCTLCNFSLIQVMSYRESHVCQRSGMLITCDLRDVALKNQVEMSLTE